MQLPDDLRTALEAELRDAPTKDVVAAVRELSQRYRAGHGRLGSPALQSELDVLAYIAYRLPATFAAVSAGLAEIRERRPDFQPESLLDIGAGPGTAAWAAASIWPDLARITSLERDARMIRLGRALAANAGSQAIRTADWKQADLAAAWDGEPADAVIAAYITGELPAEGRAGFLQRVWEYTGDICLLVEPGTPRGFQIISQAGDQLARMGAHIIAPFPQEWNCLESEADWCHFSQRVPRTRIHRTAKGSTLSYEDEKYSYVAASRQEGLPIAARVVRQPQSRSGHVRLVLCTAEGIRHTVVTRSDREAYRRAKDLRWGSAIPRGEAALFGLGP